MSLAFRPLIAVLLLSLATGVAAKKKAAAPAPAAPSACSDFYGNVNSAWLRAHPLPSGAQSFSRWDELNATAERQSQELLARTGPIAPGPAASLLSDLVASALDATGRDAAAQATAQPLLAQINGIRKPKDIAKVVAALHAAGVPALFGFDALRDPDSGQARASFYPAGLGMPDPSYYTSREPELQNAGALYRAYVGGLLKFAGVADDKLVEQTGAVLAIEQSLAAAMGASRTESVTLAQVGKSYPALYLPDFMQAQGYAPSLVDVRQPTFFAAVNRLLGKPSIPQWQAYLRAQLAHSLAPTLSQDPRQPFLASVGLAPATQAPPAARLAALSRDEASEFFSAAYAESYLAAGEEQRASAVAEAIRAAMGRAIDRAPWLGETGKTASRAKLAAMRLAIGKPIEAASFADLKFDRRNYAANVLALRRWNRARSLARLSSAVWPWPVSQSQPAIGYQPAENRLIVTAAALRAPAFEGKSVAADYGSLGALIAQQMSLAFADYTDADGRGLAGRQAGLIAQFERYAATPTLKVNSLRTQRQNAADLAAIELAWDAFTAQGAPDPAAKKAFFTAWASVWARQDSSAALAAAQVQSQFAPAKWRVNGPLVNTPAFATTFGCKAGQAMFTPGKDQLAIWR